MSEMAPEAGPVTKVARDLTEILSLYAQLPDQATNDANAALMPGGRAMVALGPVANLEAWEAKTEAGERLGRTYTLPELEDDDNAWPAYQTLKFWSEQWRRIHGAEYDGQRLSIATEANFIRGLLDWAWDNLDTPEWEKFAADVRQAKAMLEGILYAGVRPERGVPCMSCEGTLERRSEDRRDCRHATPAREWLATLATYPELSIRTGEAMAARHPCGSCSQGGRSDGWECRKCRRTSTDEQYRFAVMHLHREEAEWLTDRDMELRTGVKAGTVKVWAHRGFVNRRRDSGRVVYSVADVERRIDNEGDR